MFKCRLEEINGELAIVFPEELIKKKGWSETTELELEVVDGRLLIREMPAKDSQDTVSSTEQ